MKKIQLLFIMLCVALSAGATEPLKVQNFEGEVFAGITSGLGWNKDMRGEAGIAFGLEMRQNIRRTPCDVGLMLGLTQAQESYPMKDGDRNTINNRVVLIAATGDYNFR